MKNSYKYLYCPENTAGKYITYMLEHKIQIHVIGYEYSEILQEEQIIFKIPKNRRPHSWKI